MFWDLITGKGDLVGRLEEIDGLELVVNAEYKNVIDTFCHETESVDQNTGNPGVRLLQILEALSE